MTGARRFPRVMFADHKGASTSRFAPLHALPADLQPVAKLLRSKTFSEKKKPIVGNAFTDAAVLMPIVDGGTSRQVIVFRRPETMSKHKGQYAFPGGRRDETDADLLATALRETHEELGIDPSRIHVLGPLAPIYTPSRYRIFPYVGWLDRMPEIVAQPDEVAEVVFVPYPWLADPRNVSEKPHPLARITVGRGVVYTYQFGPHTVWGATAHMIREYFRAVEAVGR